MTESLTQLLLRRSEGGEPAILWGREAKPFLGPEFDRLIARGILSARAPAEVWQVCGACDCDLDFRPIEMIQGRPVAVCPRDRGSDLTLEAEDLQGYTIEPLSLIRQISAASGFTEEPSPVARGVWGLGFLTGGRVIFLALSDLATDQPGLIHALKAIAKSAPISLISPKMTMNRISAFGAAGVDVLSIMDVLAPSGTAAMFALDMAKLTPASALAPVLSLFRPRLVAHLRGYDIQLPPRSFELLWLLAETVDRGGGIVTRRQIERRLWGGQAVAKAAAADAIRDLREQLATLPKVAGGEELIETRHGQGYLLTLGPDSLKLIA